MIPIGSFSRLSGLTVKALRLYDRLDLLRPAMVDLQSGHRYYRPQQAPLGRQIRLLRSLDLPLEQVRALLAADAEGSRLLLTAHRRRLEERIADDRHALRLLQRLIDESCDRTRKESPVADSKDRYHCSFCGKERQQVKRLIAGPNSVFICNECIALCNEMIAEQETKGA